MTNNNLEKGDSMAIWPRLARPTVRRQDPAWHFLPGARKAACRALSGPRWREHRATNQRRLKKAYRGSHHAREVHQKERSGVEVQKYLRGNLVRLQAHLRL